MKTQETLTLEMLAPYLPYGLKVKWGTDIVTLIQTDGVNCDVFIDESTHYIKGKHNTSLENVNPFLRPLSQLTKEITVNGEKFVPIVELRNFEETNFLIHIDKVKTIEQLKIIEVVTVEYSGKKTHQVKYITPYSNMEDGIEIFEYSEKFSRFGKIMLQPYRKPLGVGGQLQMFQKLFKWHFAINIPEHLYIPIQED